MYKEQKFSGLTQK